MDKQDVKFRKELNEMGIDVSTNIIEREMSDEEMDRINKGGTITISILK